MADFRYYDFQTLPLQLRFSQARWIAGYTEWENGIGRFPFVNRRFALEWIRNIRRAARPPELAECPRVFISHRQIDDGYARRIAQLAFAERFNYWLDVIDLDPARNVQFRHLERQLGRPLDDFEKSIVTAAIIEMALLNCSHVIAVMTNNTAGSQWVPYEYGRVKEPPPFRLKHRAGGTKPVSRRSTFPSICFLARCFSTKLTSPDGSEPNVACMDDAPRRIPRSKTRAKLACCREHVPEQRDGQRMLRSCHIEVSCDPDWNQISRCDQSLKPPAFAAQTIACVAHPSVAMGAPLQPAYRRA